MVVLAYALNPAVIFNSAIWGQTDSLFTLELFLGALLLFEGRIAFGWAILMVAAITKPQALIFLPLLASWKGNWDRPERPIIAAAAGLAVATVLTLPFVEPLGLYEHYSKGAAYYAETSVNAFNLMAIIGGFRQSDSAMLGFMSYKVWAHRAGGLLLRLPRVPDLPSARRRNVHVSDVPAAARLLHAVDAHARALSVPLPALPDAAPAAAKTPLGFLRGSSPSPTT